MTWRRVFLTLLLLIAGSVWVLSLLAEDHERTRSGPVTSSSSGWKLIGWNDLGMHCTDGTDFSVFSVLPPFNTIHAHLIDPNGELVTDPAGITVTYQAIADPSGSINTTSIGKTNFWQYVLALFGVSPSPDVGLKGFAMPGSKNTPQKMQFESVRQWFTAEGVPMTPYDDKGVKNFYPMMRLTARDSSGKTLATTDIVLPVSDEMDCSTCHASGSNAAAMPSAGWVYDSNKARDVKLNILRLKDEKLLDPANPDSSTYRNMLSSAGYNPKGLYYTAAPSPVGWGKPVLCDGCHTSNAMPGYGSSSIRSFTEDMHSFHAKVVDPTNGLVLGDEADRTACYRCHPGAVTKCLRGAMGNAVAADGKMAIQCQSCHGSMAAVGSAGRQGWLQEPLCQSCHTGTAVDNNGQIRYTSTFDASGQVRQAVNLTFATTANSPSTGLSLYRFSTGHGGLQCEACHGSTHAIFPTSHPNDNIQSVQLQGHVGTLIECSTCHGTSPNTVNGGPHGMHPVGADWVSRHGSAVEQVGVAACRNCHGLDYRGTVLSHSAADRTISTEFGTKNFWRGFQIGCYTCHNGPNEDSRNPNRAAIVSNAAATTSGGAPVGIVLQAYDPDGNALTLRIVSQPAHGTVGLSNTTATYYPESGFTGTDTFTFAAWDGSTDSNLGTVSVTVQ